MYTTVFKRVELFVKGNVVYVGSRCNENGT
jgi:hypothetical protein